jgi:hypothetical protein
MQQGLSALFALLICFSANGEEPRSTQPSTLNSQPSTLLAGFASVDITPPLDTGRPVWIAGYGHNRAAQGIHDPLFARAVVLNDGSHKLALVSVDLVGLQYPAVQQIRSALADFGYVMVASTHNHEGPDVIGLWGTSPVRSGVDPEYVRLVIDRVVKAVREADSAAVPAVAEYGVAQDDSLLGDSRLPIVYDGVLRVIRFKRVTDDRPLGLLVQWNCHPESLGPRNQLLTADFPWATIRYLQEQCGCPVAYFTGAVGGLMSNPAQRIKDDQGQFLPDGNFDYAERYGVEVGRLALQALKDAAPIKLSPIKVSARPITVPLHNPLYHVARTIGVLRRSGRLWTGEFETLGEPIETTASDRPVAIETEVAYLRCGELHVACIPGELYPELVYGQYQEPVEPNVDFPSAPLEPTVMKTLPGEKTLLLGLANDEIGYIIPKRQWDEAAPYAYGRTSKQYGEINSVGPEVAPILMQALVNRVREAGEQSKGTTDNTDHTDKSRK